MSRLEELLQEAKTIAILGHVHPDGDCIGSCLAAYNYLKELGDGREITIYLEPAADKFSYLSGFSQLCHDSGEPKTYDLCLCFDSSDKARLGDFAVYLHSASRSVCVDHHITNTGYAGETILDAHASSTCEVLYELMDESKISKAVAECIYTGIIHDTGVLKFSSTSGRTMEIAGKLMDKGIAFGDIIDGSFYKKTYLQTQILGRALLESVMFLGETCIFSVIRKKDMDFYGVTYMDLDGIVDQLRIIEGVECALFLYETDPQVFKVSMRSNSHVDVSKIAGFFGGGGHVRAAGCSMTGSIHDVINNLSQHIEKQMNQQEKSHV